MMPTHTIPSCDQTAERSGLLGRFHFTSSAISGSASWTILRSFASIAPRQSGVFAINSSTGPARVMSAPHSFVYRVSAMPRATGANVIASRRAAIEARVASDELLACARDEHVSPNTTCPDEALLGHATGKPRPRLEHLVHMVLEVMSSDSQDHAGTHARRRMVMRRA